MGRWEGGVNARETSTSGREEAGQVRVSAREAAWVSRGRRRQGRGRELTGRGEGKQRLQHQSFPAPAATSTELRLQKRSSPLHFSLPPLPLNHPKPVLVLLYSVLPLLPQQPTLSSFWLYSFPLALCLSCSGSCSPFFSNFSYVEPSFFFICSSQYKRLTSTEEGSDKSTTTTTTAVVT